MSFRVNVHFLSVGSNCSERHLVEFGRVIQFLSIKFSLILNLVINSKDLPKSPSLASRNAENARETPMWGAPRTANTTSHGRFYSIGGHLAGSRRDFGFATIEVMNPTIGRSHNAALL